MNLTKALKEKKKLINKMNKAYMKFSQYNCVEVSKANKRPYIPESSLAEYLLLRDKLIKLKSDIQKANQPIYPKIFKLSELKSLNDKLRSLSTEEGVVKGRYDVEEAEYTSWMGVLEKDRMMEDIEDEIETLQSEIEEFNAITKI